MPLLTVTTGSPDRRMANPADLVSLHSALTTATARRWIDSASRKAATLLGFPPWRQGYTLNLPGTDAGWLPSWVKPVESVSAVTDIDGGAITDYTVGRNWLGIPDRLERDGGFGRLFDSSIGTSDIPYAESEKDAWILSGTLGWLMPGQVQKWVPGTTYVATISSTSYDDASGSVYAQGSWVRSYNPAITLRFECTTGGASHATTEPAAFQTASAGDTIADSGATWTARAAYELPEDLREEVLNFASQLYQMSGRDRTLSRFSDKETGSESYRYVMPKASDAPWMAYR